MIREWTEDLAGLRTLRVTVGEDPRLQVVMLHGQSMLPESLAPFARSLGVQADFFVPQGPVDSGAGSAWWPVDQERRTRMLSAGPRDPSAEAPKDAPRARATLLRVLQEVRGAASSRPMAMIGFSQGGMLACDAVLRDRAPIDALALLSSSRVSADAWEAHREALRGLPVLVSHGCADAELSFEAGAALRDFCIRGGAQVTWLPFDGGHEIPLVVWRGLRRFLRSLTP